jgi:hypothetical protein
VWGKLEYKPILSICTIPDPRFKYIYIIEPIAKSKVLKSLVNMIEVLDSPAIINNEYIMDEEVENIDKTINNKSIDIWSLHRSLEEKHKKKTKYGSHANDEMRSYLDKLIIGLKEDPIIKWENIKGAFTKALAKRYLFIQ